MVKISSSQGLKSPGVGEIHISTGVRDGMSWVRKRKSRGGAAHTNATNKKTDPLAQIGFPYVFRIACPKKRAGLDNCLIDMVGGAGFEPATLAV